MMIVIVGVNRVEYCKVKKRDLAKHFFRTRGQLYKVYPDWMFKAELRDKKGLVTTETAIMFPENQTYPYCYDKFDREVEDWDPFSRDHIIGQIHEHKLSKTDRFGRGWKYYFDTGSKIMDYVWPILPLAIAGIVLALAFMGVLE